MSSRGYLGKISAVVTANTSDLSRKLSGGAREVQAFARSTQSTISSANAAAGKSFDAIFTPLQKLQRSLDAASAKKLNLLSDTQVTRVRQMVSASEQLARPLAASAKQFSTISTAVQGEFINALVSAQRATVAIRDEINRTGEVGERRFESVRRKVEQTTQAIDRLAEADRQVAGLATGRELRFQSPAFSQQAQRAATLQQQAAALRPDQIVGGGIASLVGQQRQAAEEAARLLANLEKVRLSRNGDARAAEAAYNRQVAGLRSVNDQLEREISLTQQVSSLIQRQNRLTIIEGDRRSGAIAQRNAASFDAAAEGILSAQQPPRRFGAPRRTMESELRRSEQLQEQFFTLPEGAQQQLAEQKALFDNVANAADGNAASLGVLISKNDAFEASLRQTNAELARFQGSVDRISSIENVWDSAIRGIPANTQQLDAEFQSLASRISNLDIEDRVNLDGLIAGFRNSARAGEPLIQQFQRLLDLQRAVDGAERGDAARRSLGPDVSSTQRQFDQLRASLLSVKTQISALPPGITQELAPAIRLAEAEFVRLSRSPGATAEEIERARGEVDRLSASARAAQQSMGLMSAGGAINASGVREAAGQLEVMQRLLVQVGATAGGPVARAYEAFRQRAQRAIQEQNAGLPGVRRQLAALAEQAARAFADTGQVRYAQALRQIQRGGDVARGGFDRFSLAAQQAGFALEDFFSVTGGLDQRIRAAGNNITQLAFIIGNTTGLFVGIGAVLGTQVILAINRFVFRSQEAESAAKALNAAIDNQKSKVDELAASYSKLADEIASAGLSEEGRRRFERQQQRVEQDRTGIQAAIETAAARSPRIARARGARDLAAEQRRDAGSISGVLRAAADERAAAGRVRSLEDALATRVQARLSRFSASDPAIDILRGEQIRNQQRIERLTASRDRERVAQRISTAGLGFLFENDAGTRRTADGQRSARINRLRDRDAELEAAITEARRRAAVRLLDAGQGVTDRLSPLQQRLDELGFTQAGQEIDRLIESFRQARSQFDAGSMSEESLNKFVDGLGRAAGAADVAARSVLGFNDALQRVAGELARTVEQEATSLQDQLRRDANRAEASFGPLDQRSIMLRDFEGQAASARSRVSAGRLGVDRDIQLARQRFEADALAGRGDRRAAANAARIAVQQRIADDQTAPLDARNRARLEVDRLRQAQGRIFESLPESQALKRRSDELDIELQRLVKTIEDGRKNADRAAEFDAELNRRRNIVGDPVRGLDQAESPGERAARELRQTIANISAAFDGVARGIRPGNLAGLQENDRARNAAIEMVRQDAFRQTAPLLASFADEVRNAVLQGPSRAELSATDASTVEGSRELSRLIRGDDPNRNVDLAELQRQANEYLRIIASKKDAAVAN